jgi:four helix bundle protein
MSHDFKKLRIWETSLSLCREVYLLSQSFPREEQFGLTNQIRRAASSIAANIAEWSGRWTKKDFLHFIHIAHGSLNEVITFLTLARDLWYLKSPDFWKINEQYEVLGNMLASFGTTLKKSSVRWS